MRAFIRSKLLFLIFIIFLTYFSNNINIIGDPLNNTSISIKPTSQTVDTLENFTINVYCVPGQPIKAFEFRLSFDTTLLKVNFVAEGDIFKNFSTFFNSGTIDNAAGNILNVYGLIVGPGNVTKGGTLANISFTAKEYSGTSPIEFIDIGTWTGVTNEIGYIPITTSSGSIEIKEGNRPPPVYEENNPPVLPLKPSGPTFVEKGIEYIYSSLTIDPDGDQIRFKFDWGDGNVSDWSNFVDSNTTVSMSHNWSEISNYSVRAIAQDTHGLNSSWSPPLNVTVSQSDLGIPPVVIINIYGNFSVNETIIFNASDSYDPDGFIVSYEWDFGDGEVDFGINVSHAYKQPGDYTVTILATDNNGSKYSKSIIINVASDVEESGVKRSVPLSDFTLFVIIFFIAVLSFLVFFYKNQLSLFVSSHIINPFLSIIIYNRKFKIKKLDSKIFEKYKDIQKTGLGNTISRQLSNFNMKRFYDEVQKVYIKTELDSKLNSAEKISFNEFDKFQTGEKVDRLLKIELEHDKPPVETVDDLKIKNIERLVDELFISKMREKIDSM